MDPRENTRDNRKRRLILFLDELDYLSIDKRGAN
jgi:hypothetical protein